MAVVLRPMTASEYDVWRGPSIEEYAQSFVDSGILTIDEARERADKEFAELLPDGLETPDHMLWTAYDDATRVGILWVKYGGEAPHRRAFIYDIHVDEQYRRRGHAQAMIETLMADARKQGVASIGLNVFGHNAGAMELYRKLGFEVSSTSMRRTL